MTSYGYFLACEEFAPGQLLEQARRAADTWFTRLAISDHFHPGTMHRATARWSGPRSEPCRRPCTCP